MNRVESLFARMFLILMSILVTVFVVEAFANFYLWNIATSDEFNYYASIDQVKARYGQDFYIAGAQRRLRPHHYLGYVTTENFEKLDDRHNSLGFRGEEISLKKPDGVYRIVAIGESTTYGTQVDTYNDAYPALLQKYLRDNGYPNVEVINAGVGGYTSYETLMNLQFRALEVDPDLVILYQGSNDIHARFTWPPEEYRADNSGYRAPQIQDTVLANLWEYSTSMRIIGILLGWTTSQSDIRWKVAHLDSASYYPELERQFYGGKYPSGIFEEISGYDMLQANPPTNYERNLRNMVASTTVNNVDMLLLTYAVYSESNWFKASSKEYEFGTEQHNDITRQIADELETYFLDFAAISPHEPNYFADGRHMTGEGNAKRAEIVGNYIIENILDVNN